jgi:putative ATP-dependent endonuclease of OLD family
MLLRKVDIENYRGVERLELELDETTVLIGENNVGKTSVLEALESCLARADGRRGRAFRDYDHRRPGSDRELPDGHEVRITLTFYEKAPDEWSEEVAQAMGDVLQFDDADRRWLIVRITDRYDATTRTFDTSVTFLNIEGADLRPAAPDRQVASLRRFAPVFYLPATRDAGDFRSGGPFWGPFLRDPELPTGVREGLEAELKALNDKVIQATPALEPVRKRLEDARQLVDLGTEETASLEAVPGRVPELLRRTEVRLSSAAGASLPLDRHGGGTQNVAVLRLFEAYLDSMLSTDYASAATPILALEEPEAHLHPSAVRSAWGVLERMPGQRIVATHSGDLLSRVPLDAVRRMARKDGTTTVHRVGANTLDANERRKVDFHIRRARGELLFARAWLLVEGETEYWVFQGAAEALGVNLERVGIVEYAQVDPLPFAKVADDLGITWHAVADGDQAGLGYRDKLLPQLQGRAETDGVTVLPYRRIEQLLCEEGFGEVYERSLSSQRRANVTVPPGDPGYWLAVSMAIGKKQKLPLAVEAVDVMRRCDTAVPPTLRAILEAMERLAGA